MKIKPLSLLIGLALSANLHQAVAQGTAFTYQGHLNDSANPANGKYDFQFQVFDAATNGNSYGSPNPNNIVGVGVTNGLFTVSLDFGAGVFTGTNYWVEIGVRTNGSVAAYGTLAPRQAITPVPYAITAENAGTAAAVSGTVSVGQITGVLPVSQLPTTIVTNGASGVSISGTFNGNGAGISNLNLSASSSGTIRGPGIFAPPMTLPVGAFPLTVVAADVNGDGALDLISANFGDNTLTVLTNNRNGSFGFYATLPVGNEAESVAAADVNNDGKIDLICANYGAGTLTVLTNNGTGGFGSYATLSVGSGPEAVVVADVNGDGKPDLISANQGASTLSVLTNNGAGGFGSYATLSVSSGPFSVVAADINGDGRPDLICANNALTVFTNNGSGGFGLHATLNAAGAGAVVAADMNGDGKPDLIYVNSGSASLSVLTNNGSGGFGLNATLSTGGTPYSVVAADVNGDGKLDLICSKANSGATAFTLVVFTNNGSGSFGSNATLTVGRPPYWVTAADLNGDGKPDLISANAVDNTLTVLLNQTIFTGAFVGDGSGLTSLNAANLTGTIADTSLSADVALRTGGNTFNGTQIVTNGNVGIGTTTPAYKLDVTGNINASGTVSANGVALTSDRNAKENFTAINARAVLDKVAALPVTEWNYKTDSKSEQHIGPMAQDFHATFGLDGNDDKHISVIDEGGVALAAIQGLNQKVDEKDAEIQSLKLTVDKLKKTMQSLALAKKK